MQRQATFDLRRRRKLPGQDWTFNDPDEQIYRSFSENGNPTLKTTLAVMRALGIELTATAACGRLNLGSRRKSAGRNQPVAQHVAHVASAIGRRLEQGASRPATSPILGVARLKLLL